MNRSQSALLVLISIWTLSASRIAGAASKEECLDAHGKGQDLRDKGQALNITTDVLMGTTIAAGAVTLILFLTRPEVPKEKATATQVYVVPTGTGLSVLGSF